MHRRYTAFRGLVALAALAIAGFVAFTALAPVSPWSAQAFVNFATCVSPLVAAAACASRAPRGGPLRRTFIWFAVAAAAWASGNLAWTWYEVVANRPAPFPSVADVGYLAAVPAAAVAVLSLPGALSGASRVRGLLDGGIIGASLTFVSGALVLGPALEAAEGSLFARAIGLAYPIGDVVLIGVVVFAVTNRSSRRDLRVLLLGLGLVMLAVADSGFVYLTLKGLYQTGAVTDVGWFAGWLMVALAAAAPAALASDGPSHEVDVTRLNLLVPYVPVVGVLAVGAVELMTGDIHEGLIATALALLALIVLRQVLTLLENAELTARLEAKVVDRTAELAATNRQFRSLVQNASDLVCVFTPERVVSYASPSAETLLGRGPADLVGAPLSELVHREDMRSLLKVMDAVPDGGAVPFEGRLAHADGSWRWADTTVTNLSNDSAVRGYVLNARDITDQRRLEDELRERALHDPLTRLANRILFRDRVERALGAAGRSGSLASVLFLDLDGFKGINDSRGHAVGDQLLVQVGDRLRQVARTADTIARLGGDEFAVLLEVHDPADAEAVAQRVVASLRTPFHVEGREAFIRGSVGVCTVGAGETSADELLRDADVAMYMAKTHGRDRYELFEASMHESAVRVVEMDASLRRAIDRRELQLAYQPTIDLQTGQTVGVEALLRWKHGDRFLPPTEFVPVAEETGLIVQIGDWVLRSACEQLAAWERAHPGRPMHVSVNVAARQLAEPDFVARVAAILRQTGVLPGHVILEITEGALVHGAEALERLRQLKSLGLRLAIDDFGTGYSSLARLQVFPVDILKIDKSFVDGLGRRDADLAVVRAIVELARTFDMDLVAEGIEDEEQLQRLLLLRCRFGQGFFFAEPMTSEALTERLRAEAGVHAGAM